LVLRAGATDLPSITFESDSVAIGRRLALGEALAKARSDAEALATAGAGSLGRLLEVSTQAGSGYRTSLQAVSLTVAARGAPAITPQDVVVQVSVQARWEFVPGH